MRKSLHASKVEWYKDGELIWEEELTFDEDGHYEGTTVESWDFSGLIEVLRQGNLYRSPERRADSFKLQIINLEYLI